MKKVVGYAVVVLMLLALASCTPFWKPSESDLVMMEQTLGAANVAEIALFTTMDALCAAGTLPADKCADGYGLDKEWQLSYSLAIGAIADYRSGVGGVEMIQKYYPQAIATGVRIITLIKDLIASKPATAGAFKNGVSKFERNIKLMQGK